jgi:DNA replication protein DnaC
LSEACPRCLGSGFEVRAGEDGVERARPCACRDRRREELLLAAARIPRRYEHCSFDNFEIHDPAQGRVLQIARRFARDYAVGERGLLLAGPCGAGKTHLAVSILRALILERGVRGLFYDFQDLLKEVQASYNPVNQTSEMSVLQPVFTAEVLVLDDLGAQKPTAWVRDTVGHIITNRYNDRRTTMFTTNRGSAPPEDAARRPGREIAEASLADQIGVRLHSRIYEMCHVVDFRGPDYRKLAKHPGLGALMRGPG